MKKLLMALLCLSLVGCIGPAGNDLNMQGAIGKHCSELVAIRGLPQQTFPDGQGGEVWIYTQERIWVTPATYSTTVNGNARTYGSANSQMSYGNLNTQYDQNTRISGTAQTTYRPATQNGYQATRSFFVNKDGVVYRYAWRGL